MKTIRTAVIAITALLFFSSFSLPVQASIPALGWVSTHAVDARPYGIDIDGSGNIYLAHYSSSSIRKYNSSGTFISSFGSYGTGNSNFKYPYSVAVDGSGNIYVADTSNNQIKKFNSSYVWQWTKGTTSSSTLPGYFNRPHTIAVGPDNNIYVSDGSNYRVQVFDTNGNLLRVIGSRGSVDGKFQGPTGITFDGMGNIYVADNMLDNIQVFEPDGDFIRKFGQTGSGPGQMSGAFGMAFDNNGNLNVVDTSNHKIVRFASDFTPLTSFGQNGTGNGQFASPMGIALDGSGTLIVVDSNNSRIQKISYGSTDYQVSGVSSSLDITNASNGLNIESGTSNGLNGATALVRIKDNSGLAISDVTVDMTSDRSWASLIGDSDRTAGKSYIHNLIGSAGVGATHSLYIPVPAGRTSQSVYICPNATDLASVSDSCPGGVERTAGSYVESFGNITVSSINNLGDSVTYWKIDGMTGSGGLAYDLMEYSGGGSGTLMDPYEITSCIELQEMNSERGAVYELLNDIDCTATVGWNAGAGFIPIGDATNPFIGQLIGNDYTIDGLFINKITEYTGLIGSMSGANVSDVNLTNIDYKVEEMAGGLIGYMANSTVDDIHVSGNIGFTLMVTYNAFKVGGAIGYADLASQITNSSSDVELDFSPGYGSWEWDEADWVGGFIGVATGATEIDNCSSSGDIYSHYSSYDVGGFIGWLVHDSVIRNSHSTGNVYIGLDLNPVDRAGDSYDNGGFAGGVGWDGYWLWGRNDAYIYDSYSTGDVYILGEDNYDGGAFVGTIFNNSIIEDSYSTGELHVGISNNDMGGFVGFSRQDYGDGTDRANISRCYSTGDVYADYDTDDVGGFVGTLGWRNLTIEDSYSLGDVYGGSAGNEYEYIGSLGGFVGGGSGSGIIRRSFSLGSVNASGESWDVGGFAGYISGNTLIEESASLGASVQGFGDVGGFVGGLNNSNALYTATIRNSYSRTNAISQYLDIQDPFGSDADAAGFVGYLGNYTYNLIENSYATGSIGMISNPIDNVNTTLTADAPFDATVITVADATNIVPGGYLMIGNAGPPPFTTTLTSGVTAGAVTLQVADASGLVAYDQIVIDTGVEGKMEWVQIQTVVGNTLNLFAASAVDFDHDAGASVQKYVNDVREVVLVREVNGNNITVTREMAYSNNDDWVIGDPVIEFDFPTISGGSGGFLGYPSIGIITNSYWDMETSGLNTSPGGTGLTTAQMKSSANYSGWDFTDTWGIDSNINDGYPFLSFDDPTFSGLDLSTGDLNPSFNRFTTFYSIDVPGSSINFTPYLNQTLYQSLSLDGVPVTEGVATPDQSLNPGSNTFEFDVISYSFRPLTYELEVNSGGAPPTNTPTPTSTPTPTPTPADTPWNGNCDYCWTKTWGGIGDDNAWSIAHDSVDNKYITGQFSDTVNFNNTGIGSPDNKSSNGSYDIFLTKYNSDGSYAWTLTMGGNGDDRGYYVHLDKDNNIYLTGYFSSSNMDFNLTESGVEDLHSSNGDADIFITKINADGSYAWTRTMGDDTDRDVGLWLDSDSQGRIYLTGYFGFNGVDPAIVEFNTTGSGPSDSKTSHGHGDAFISSFNGDGSYRFTRAYGSVNADSAYGMSLDNSDNLYIAGAFMDNDVDFNQSGSGPADLRSSAGCSDSYLTKYNNDGSYAWTYTIGGTGCDYAYGLQIDNSGNVYIVGYFTSTDIDFNGSGSGSPDLRASNGSGDIYLTKYTNTGSYSWTRTMGGINFDWGRNLVLDNAGHVIITGQFASPNVNFNTTGSGSPEYKSSNSTDIFTTKFTTAGAYVWTKTIGNSGLDFGMGIATDQANNIFVTGQFQGTDTNFNKDGKGPADNRTSYGGADAFMTKYTDGSDSSWCPVDTPIPSPTPTTRRTYVTPTPVCLIKIDGVCVNEILITNVTTTITGNSVKICWETNIPSSSYINYSQLGGDMSLTSPIIEGTNVFCQDLFNLTYDQDYQFTINASYEDASATYEDAFRTGIQDAVTIYSCTINANPVNAKLEGGLLTMPFATDNADSCTLSWGIEQSNLEKRADLNRTGNRFTSYLLLDEIKPSTIYYRINCSSGTNQCSSSNRISLANNSTAPALDFFGMDLNFGPFEFVALTGLVLTIAPISIAFPQFWLYGIAWIFPRKKQKPWGIVYDLKTMNPIAFAVIRLFDANGSMLKQTVSDLQGRFSFLADPGTYQISVEHSEYNKIFKNINILREDSKIAENIGLVSLEGNKPVIASLRSSLGTFFMRTYWLFGFLGMLFSFIAMITNFEFINVAIFTIYVIQMIMMIALRPKRDFGYVYNALTGERIKGAFIQVQDVTQGRQVDVQMSDEKGRFGFNLDQGEYILIVSYNDKKAAKANIDQINLKDGSIGFKYDTEIKNLEIGLS